MSIACSRSRFARLPELTRSLQSFQGSVATFWNIDNTTFQTHICQQNSFNQLHVVGEGTMAYGKPVGDGLEILCACDELDRSQDRPCGTVQSSLIVLAVHWMG